MDYIVNTPCGALRGTAGRVEGVAAYKGIRYATAGRWEYPVQVKSWEGVYDATQYGACSYQPRSFYDEETSNKKAFYYREFRKGETYTYSEDCLSLNVFTPRYCQRGGQAAGAESVQCLCLSPLSKGLFQKAVMSSAGGVLSAKKRYGTRSARWQIAGGL